MESHNRMLSLRLTDGYNFVTAVEFQKINFLSLRVPLGSKILIKPCRVIDGVLFLEPSCVTLLGGSVASLENKENEKNASKQRIAKGDAPKFVPLPKKDNKVSITSNKERRERQESQSDVNEQNSWNND